MTEEDVRRIVREEMARRNQEIAEEMKQWMQRDNGFIEKTTQDYFE